MQPDESKTCLATYRRYNQGPTRSLPIAGQALHQIKSVRTGYNGARDGQVTVDIKEFDRRLGGYE